MKLNPLILAILVFYQHPVLADIVTDGTVGPAQSINATDGQLTIGQELGSLKGANLFHSFKQFDIERKETATFTGDDAIQNVISRVTGGTPSHIDGILRSKVGSADFYFINPAGVVFEKNSQVDVPASFHISTAGELIFSDGSSFSALNPETSTLTVATPEAFGFTAGQEGSLKIIGGQLKFKPGTGVSFSANSLAIQPQVKQQAIITGEQTNPPSKGIHLDLSAVDSATAQKIPIAGLATTATGGELLIESSIIRVSGNGSGRLAISAGTMSAKDSQLVAVNTGNIDMSPSDDGLNVRVDSLKLDETSLRSSTMKAGQAGPITVDANKTLELLNEGKIISINTAGGKSSDITVTAEQLIIDGPKALIASNAQVINGNTGDVSIIVDESLQVLNGGKISSEFVSSIPLTSGNIKTIETNSGGKTGKLTIQAGQLIIDGDGKTSERDIFGSSNATGISTLAVGGDAGLVDITVNSTLQVLDSGEINTISFNGEGGDIILKGGQWFQLQNAEITTSVISPTSNSKAGNININIPVLILDTGKILADTISDQGTKGDVTINSTEMVASRGGFNTRDNINPNFVNVIRAAPNAELKITSPELNIVGTLAGVITPSLNIERLSQDPCAHGHGNSLKNLGHGGAPAFQHGENYLPINRLDESEREPEDMGTLQTISPINTEHKNTVMECAKSQRTSLN